MDSFRLDLVCREQQMFPEDRITQKPVLAALAEDEAGLLARFGVFRLQRLEPGILIAVRKEGPADLVEAFPGRCREVFP